MIAVILSFSERNNPDGRGSTVACTEAGARNARDNKRGTEVGESVGDSKINERKRVRVLTKAKAPS